MRMAMTSIVLAAVMFNGAAVHAEPGRYARVVARLTYDAPPVVKTGDEVTTVLRFVATQDIEQLDVAVREGSGLAILSEPYDAVFSKLPKGTVRELQVRIRITGERQGRLVVRFTTVSGTYGTATESTVVEYGAAK